MLKTKQSIHVKPINQIFSKLKQFKLSKSELSLPGEVKENHLKKTYPILSLKLIEAKNLQQTNSSKLPNPIAKSKKKN